MLWFSDRDNEKVEVETRFDNNNLEYVLTIRWPDGREQTERYPDSDSFSARVIALSEELKSMNWRNTGSPIVLPEGVARQTHPPLTLRVGPAGRQRRPMCSAANAH